MQLLYLAAASLITLCTAQNGTSATSGVATTASGNYGLDPDSVDSSTRDYWCAQQTASCPLICGDINNDDSSTIQNSCDSSSLSYQCVCSNNQSPNATQYTQTVPYFECTTAADQCVANCDASNTQCQSDCRTSRACGATDVKKENRTTTASSSASSASATSTSSGTLLNGSDTGAAVALGPNMGVMALVGMVSFGLAVLL